MRARQLLAALEPHVHDDARGFLPTREAGMTWLQVQGSVELAQQAHQCLAGIGTDFQKALNCIRREPLFALASMTGVPDSLVKPWQKITSHFTRRFLVCNQVSSTQVSNKGFAEGCPLSVTAMVLIDWSLHLYQAHYAPQVRCLSFVDNVSMFANDPRLVIWAFFTMKTFLTLWGLSVDFDKSYCWGTTTASRALISTLGLISQVQDINELGGSLTFAACNRVRIFLKRGASLHDRWLRLRRSRAPLVQKLIALPMTFWAAALHGALSCNFADGHLGKLRAQAVKSMGIQLAGSNPMLRLSLAQPPTADPGFYQLRTCIFDFRRLCHKGADIRTSRRTFFGRFDGRLWPGPFSKILSLLSRIGWSLLHPPLILDHDGFQHDLFALSNSLLEDLLLDAWLQHVSQQMKRKTMHGLCGIDVRLTKLDHDNQSAIDLARIRALQSGAFVSSWQHAKFDNTKQPICQQCLQPDTQRHWLVCPRFADARAQSQLCSSWISDLPDCALLHLLAPRAPFHFDLKNYFASVPDASEVFLSVPRQGVVNHIFTDGSCFRGATSNLDVAAWASVNASSNQIISVGHVPGLGQSIGRAEIWALVSSMRWLCAFRASAITWVDSAYVVRRAKFLLDHPNYAIPLSWENHDLWICFRLLVINFMNSMLRSDGRLPMFDGTLCENAYEEYLAAWNDVADGIAVTVNQHRGRTARDLLTEAAGYYETWTHRLKALRQFYLQVAEERLEEPPCIDLTEDTEAWSTIVEDTALSEALPVNWRFLFSTAEPFRRSPPEFVFSLIEYCFSIESQGTGFEAISFVELVLLRGPWCTVSYPRCHRWQMEAHSNFRHAFTAHFSGLDYSRQMGLSRCLSTFGLESFSGEATPTPSCWFCDSC